MSTVKAPPRNELPVVDPVTLTQVDTRLEHIGSWINRGRVRAWEAEPKPAEITIVLDIPTNRELLLEADFTDVPGLIGSHPQIFGMGIKVDPDVEGYEIRYKTQAEQAEDQARRVRALL